MSEPEKLFQNDPDFDDSIQVSFPNGKAVPLGKINKPHARVPGRTVPKNEEDSDRFYKEQKEKREEAQRRVSEYRQAHDNGDVDKNEKASENEGKLFQQQNGQKPLNAAGNDKEKDDKNENEKDPFEGKTPDDILVSFPNGKSVPLSKINKPHRPVFPKQTDNAGGLLHNSGHRPSSEQ